MTDDPTRGFADVWPLFAIDIGWPGRVVYMAAIRQTGASGMYVHTILEEEKKKTAPRQFV